MTSLTIEYELAEDDVVALNDYMAKNVPAIRRRIVASLAVVSLGTFALGLLILCYSKEVGFLFMVSAVIAALFFPLFAKTARRRSVRALLESGSNAASFGKQVLTVTPDEIRREHVLGHSANYWKGVDRIATDDQYAFVFVTSMSVIIIPRRELHEPTFEKFVGLAQEYWGDAHS